MSTVPPLPVSGSLDLTFPSVSPNPWLFLLFTPEMMTSMEVPVGVRRRLDLKSQLGLSSGISERREFKAADGGGRPLRVRRGLCQPRQREEMKDLHPSLLVSFSNPR
ncbi:hypothetical protein GQ457_03G005100 [Hibiscus cannabinus]